MVKKWSVVIMILISSSTIWSNNSWKDSTDIRNYLTENYPYIFQAIKTNTYQALRDFDPKLFLGENLAKYPSNTSFAQGLLIGAKWRSKEKPSMELSFADISFGQLSYTDLTSCNFFHTKAFKANLKDAILDCTKIVGADFKQADLSNTFIVIDNEPTLASKETLMHCLASGEDAIFDHVRSPQARRIDIQMYQLYQRGLDSKNAQIRAKNTRPLIQRAKDIDKYSSDGLRLLHKKSGDKGKKQLKKLFEQNTNAFSSSSTELIDDYLKANLLRVSY